MDMGKILVNVYIDLSKAFDTLVHSILLHKLIHYGMCGVENLLFRNYFSGRHQYIEFNGSTSKTKSISLSVLQGSFEGLYYFLCTLMTYLG